MVDDLRPRQQPGPVAVAGGGHQTSMHQRDLLPAQLERGKGFVRVANERLDVLRGDAGLGAFDRLRGLARADQRAAVPRHERQHAPAAGWRRQGDIARRLRRHEIHGLDQRR
jgi:hypothetical protein